MSLLKRVLEVVSGKTGVKYSEQLLFDKIIGFRGFVPGVGTSTIVQGVAHSLSELTNYTVCVVDTNFMFPTQYPMLVKSGAVPKKDYLDFSGELSDIVVETSFKNIFLVYLRERNLVDMLSSRDSEVVVKDLISSLKTYFDIILIDLSYEFTKINTYMGIGCNKIITVADQSLKCIYNLRKARNLLASLAISPSKSDKVVLNKVVPDVSTNVRGVLEDSGLRVIGEIPLSLEIAKLGISGKSPWSLVSENRDIITFTGVINSLVEDIVQLTPLNQKFVDQELIKQKEEKEKKKEKKKGKLEKVKSKKKDNDVVEDEAKEKDNEVDASEVDASEVNVEESDDVIFEDSFDDRD